MIVLDTSALIDVVLDQPSKGDILDQLDDEVFAPAHQLAEVFSAVARLERSGAIAAAAAAASVRDAADLVQELIVPDHALLSRAFELRERIRVVDGLYVALAERLRCRLVTTDRRLAASQPPCEIVVPGI